MKLTFRIVTAFVLIGTGYGFVPGTMMQFYLGEHFSRQLFICMHSGWTPPQWWARKSISDSLEPASIPIVNINVQQLPFVFTMHRDCEGVRVHLKEVQDELKKLQKRVELRIHQNECKESYVRVRLMLADLNRLYNLESRLKKRGKHHEGDKLRSAHMDRNTGTHFITNTDTPDELSGKTIYAIERLTRLNTDVVEKIERNYGASMLPSVLEELRELKLDDIEVDENVREKADDWWAGFEG